MGKFLNTFNNGAKKAQETGKFFGDKVNKYANDKVNKPKVFRTNHIRSERKVGFGEKFDDDSLEDIDNSLDAMDEDYDNPYIENIQPAQKPASFHHFILENQYKDLEKSIRGYKDVFNKDTRQWEVKRKSEHCFTDEESEEILRTAQSHLATDIKLTFYNKETFGIRFLAIYERIEFLFKRIMEYRYGRYGDYRRQSIMKEQAVKIFVELITRIEANYLRAVGGNENKLTHLSVQSQESLQGRGEDDFSNRRYT